MFPIVPSYNCIFNSCKKIRNYESLILPSRGKLDSHTSKSFCCFSHVMTDSIFLSRMKKNNNYDLHHKLTEIDSHIVGATDSFH